MMSPLRFQYSGAHLPHWHHSEVMQFVTFRLE